VLDTTLSLSDLAPVGIYQSDADGNCLYVNDGWCAIADMTPEQAYGKGWLQAIHPDDRDRVWQSWQASITQHSPFTCEYRLLHHDGEVVWVIGRANVQFDATGKPTSLTGSITDISHHIDDSQTPGNDYQLANAILENAGILLIVLDKKGLVVRFNQACEALTHYRAEEIEGQPIWDTLLLPEERHQVKTVFSQLTDKALPNKFENYWLTRTGEKRLISWSNTIICNAAGEVEHVIAAGIDITEKRTTEIALEKQSLFLNEAQRITHIGSWCWDINNGKLTWSDETFRIFGREPGSINATYESFLAHIHTKDRSRVVAAFNDALAHQCDYDLSYRVIRPNGDIRTVHARGDLQHDSNGKATQLIGTIHDITEQAQAEQKMLKLSQALQQTADAIMITDHNGVIEYINPSFTKITGYSETDLIGKTQDAIIGFQPSASHLDEMWHTVRHGETFRDVVINQRKNGQRYYEEKTISPVRDANGQITHYIATSRDVTKLMETQEHLAQLAHHDPLTGLPNRMLFMDRLQHALERAQRNQRHLALLFLDIDQFKKINDTLGHQVGDTLLKQMAKRLQSSLRSEDTIARLGGDEFAIVIENGSGEHGIRHIAAKLVKRMNHPFMIDGHELLCTTSIGIAQYPNDGKNAEALLKNADTAMYKAKQSGRNHYCFFSRNMNTLASQQRHLETNLRHALVRNEFQLHYQPLFDSDNRIVSFEALVRWHSPIYGLRYPGEFLPVLEESGIIIPVGEWIIQTACHQLSQWHKRGIGTPNIAINLSSRQLSTLGLQEMIEHSLQQSGLAPQYLDIEFTEKTLLENNQATHEMLEALSNVGVRMSLDDFGCDYSSLNYLTRYPITTVKIDHHLIRRASSSKDATLIRGISALARELGIKTVAEGVESEAQRAFLKRCHCDYLQGELLSKPLNETMMNELLDGVYATQH